MSNVAVGVFGFMVTSILRLLDIGCLTEVTLQQQVMVRYGSKLTLEVTHVLV